MKLIYNLSKKSLVNRAIIAAVLLLWMFLVLAITRGTWIAAIHNFGVSMSPDYHSLKVDNPRPLFLIEKILLFLALPYFYLVGWFAFKRTVLRGRLDNVREYIRYWIGLFIILVFLTWFFCKTFWGAWLLSILITTGFLYGISYRTKPDKFIVDGTIVRSFQEVKRYYQYLKPEDDSGVQWGGLTLPSSEAVTNFLIVGSVGSGKTISLSLLMQSVLPQIGTGQGVRAMIYDFKGEMPSLIAGIHPSAEIHIFNPLHENCTAWNMAADITSDMNAEMFANVLFPDPPGGRQGHDTFFLESARKCLKAVILFLNDTAPKQWTLRDIVYIMLSQKRLTKVLGYSERTNHNLDYFAADRQAAAVMATIKSKLEVYIPIAALWYRAKRKLSLKDWANGESIIVLGHDPENAISLRALNALIFDRAAQILLKKENVNHPQTYLFCDELGTLQKLSMLEETAKTGRSKGISIAVGFQSIDDLYALYGKENANVIISQFLNKAFLRLSDETTSKWAETLIGQHELLRITKQKRYTDFWSHLTGWDIYANHSDSENYTIKPAVMASEFREILPINEATNQGLTGWYVGHFVYKHYITFKKLIPQLPQRSSQVKDRADAPDHWQRFESWTMADLQRLNLIQHQELLPEENTDNTSLPPSDSEQLPEKESINWEAEAEQIFERFDEFLDDEDENDEDDFGEEAA